MSPSTILPVERIEGNLAERKTELPAQDGLRVPGPIAWGASFEWMAWFKIARPLGMKVTSTKARIRRHLTLTTLDGIDIV